MCTLLTGRTHNAHVVGACWHCHCALSRCVAVRWAHTGRNTAHNLALLRHQEPSSNPNCVATPLWLNHVAIPKSCRDTELPSPTQARSQPQKATHVATPKPCRDINFYKQCCDTKFLPTVLRHQNCVATPLKPPSETSCCNTKNVSRHPQRPSLS